MLKLIQKFLLKFGYNLVDINEIPGDIVEKEFLKSYNKNKEFSMTSVIRMYALYNGLKYILNNQVEGDIVECGVWKGGSMMLCADILLNQNIKDRKLWLYDTYTGMSKPTDKDINSGFNMKAFITWKKRQTTTHNTWCYSPIEEVKENLQSTGYPENNLVYVKGKVEDTIPCEMPDKISLLHLDTDWYESTYHELKHLFPLLSKNGVLIVDDYGFWQGSRDAVNHYFKENSIKMLFNRIDYNGRSFIKTDVTGFIKSN